MNNLNEAANLLKNNWCTGHLNDGDKFCAIGALGMTQADLRNIPVRPTWDDKEFQRRGADYRLKYIKAMEPWNEWEKKMYASVDSMKEATVLAETILEQNPDWSDRHKYSFDMDRPTEVIWNFNDDQETVEPVIAMFEKAAANLDEKA